MSRSIRIVVSTLFQDAGEATRALEIARGLREECPPDFHLEMIMISHGSRFEEKFRQNGFAVEPVDPKLPGIGFKQDLKTTALQMVGDETLAIEILRGEVAAFRRLQPDVVLHGFWPIAGIAAKIAKVPLEISYIPIPFEPRAFFTYLLEDVPDFLVPLTYLPQSFRKRVMAAIPKSMKLSAPMLRQDNLVKACSQCGGASLQVRNLFDMLKSDFTIVNDFPVFYEGKPLPENFAVTGPLFAPDQSEEGIDPEILEHFQRNTGKLKIFCTLGSSGNKEHLLEAIRALKTEEREWEAVILCPAAVCPIDEAKALVQGYANLYVTDSFVPALKVNGMADLVLSHGGQGTVQTAVACGTPIVGFAVQPEQQVNLDHIAAFGAAVRLPSSHWKAEQIRRTVRKVAADPSYRENMNRLKSILFTMDGKQEAAQSLWNFIVSSGRR